MKPQTELLNNFRIQHQIPIPELNSAVREINKLFGPPIFTMSGQGNHKLYREIVNRDGEACEICKKSPPEWYLCIASKEKPITKETPISDLRLLCRAHGRIFAKEQLEKAN